MRRHFIFSTLAFTLSAAGLLLSCSAQNSFSGDAVKYGPQTQGGTGKQPAARVAAYNAVRPILQARCTECHTWPGNTLEQWLTSPLVKPGDPNCSPLYYRLQNSGAVCSTLHASQTMPDEEAPLSPDEMTAVKTFIESLAP